MKKNLLLLLLLFVAIPLFSQQQYKLSISTSYGDHGMPLGPVYVSNLDQNVYGEGEFYFDEGEVVTLVGCDNAHISAPPPCGPEGTFFLSWSGAVNTSTRTISIVMDGDKEIFAHYRFFMYHYMDPCGGGTFVELSLTQPNVTIESGDSLDVKIYGTSMTIAYNFSAIFTYDPELFVLDTTKGEGGFLLDYACWSTMSGQLLEPGRIKLSGRIDMCELEFLIYLKAIAPGETSLTLDTTAEGPIYVKDSEALISITGDPISQDDAVCYIPFREQEGDIAFDVVDDGDINDVIFSSGIQWSTDGGSSIEFSDFSATANMGVGTFGIENTNEFTLLFKIKIDQGYLNALQCVIRRGVYAYPFFLRVQPNRVFTFGCRTDRVHYIYSPEPLNVETWYTIATTYKDGEQSLYIDGEKVSSAEIHGALNLSTVPQTTYLGSIPGIYSSSLVGGLDDLKIYNRALTAEEIKAKQE